ncbi:ABC transporter ATP-binding protein [Desulfobacula toluolica]|uniref:MsbA: lipid A export ATP-binding/permease protein n=1 Tax=Desulfobacula toluolica (strain DSM 7467 / Tol2) TaxID=651182 RepID=K0NM38_DESTT|nr:ABC transporter transmembrane domain-containing protein [Desulfobacula toluolica]CCK79777.1 MsbA: lipid A export ATP-binding/permease protein [Desulfobacula toluolica Tol2]
MKKKNSKLTKSRRKEIISLVVVYWKRLLLAALCMVIVAGANGAMAFLVKPVMDDIFIRQNRDMLLLIPGLAILVFFLKGAGSYGSEYFMNYIGENIIRFFRDSLYEKITDLPISFIHKEKTGALMSRITNDVNIVKGMVSTAVINVFRDFFSVIAFLFVIFYRDWQLALGAFIVLPLAFYPIVLFGRRVRKFSTGTQETMADLNSFLHETFTGSKIIKIFNLQVFEKNRFKEKTRELFRLEMKKVVAKALSSPVMEFLGGLGIAFIIWFGGIRVINGTSTPGTFFSFLTAVMMLYDPVKKLSKLNNTIQEGIASATRIFDVLEEPSVIMEKENPEILEGSSFDVEFDNVGFSYNKNEASALNDINLKVAPGEVLALVGMSGGGKTSLVNLVPRLYDVTTGSVFIAGKNVKDLSIKSLRDHISIVTQEPILFNESVKDNIRYGKMDATDLEIENAAKAAFAYDFIQGFPNGFDTVIGELGSRLSGGEKQRICIARALIKDAPILILDEATSALDSEAEQVVQKALENLMRGRTSFVIAHRLSTINYASRVILLKDGAIKEQGTHEELMALKGDYFKLQIMQAAKGLEN